MKNLPHLRRQQRGFLIDPFRYSTGGGETPDPSTYTTSGIVAYWDASATASFPGSGQTFANLIASPADSSAQADYDYTLGDSSANVSKDPIFVLDDVRSYFTFDNAGSLQLLFSRLGTVTSFFRTMHKSGSKFTIELWMRWAGTEGVNIAPLFDTGTSDQGGSDMSRGVMYADLGNAHADRGHSIRVKRDASAATALSKKADAAISSGVVHMLACSIDGTGAASSFLYKDGAYDPVAASNTFDGTFATPGTLDSINPPRLGCRGDGLGYVGANVRLYLVRLYNRNLSKAELDANYDGARGRFGI